MAQTSGVMPLRLAAMTEAEAREIAGWRYDPPYERYNLRPWEVLAAECFEFADPVIRAEQYVSMHGANGVFAGFGQLFPLVGVTRLGIGLRPALCSCGLGAAAIGMLVAEARRRKPEDAIDLEVYAWNHRAIRVYEKAGFAEADRYGKRTPEGVLEVVCMEWGG